MKAYFKILLTITVLFYIGWLALSFHGINLGKGTALIIFILCYSLTLFTGYSGYWNGFDYIRKVKKTDEIDEKSRKYWTYAMIFFGVWYTGLMLAIGIFIFE